jgi:hypothetical protein
MHAASLNPIYSPACAEFVTALAHFNGIVRIELKMNTKVAD